MIVVKGKGQDFWGVPRLPEKMRKMSRGGRGFWSIFRNSQITK